MDGDGVDPCPEVVGEEEAPRKAGAFPPLDAARVRRLAALDGLDVDVHAFLEVLPRCDVSTVRAAWCALARGAAVSSLAAPLAAHVDEGRPDPVLDALSTADVDVGGALGVHELVTALFDRTVDACTRRDIPHLESPRPRRPLVVALVRAAAPEELRAAQRGFAHHPQADRLVHLARVWPARPLASLRAAYLGEVAPERGDWARSVVGAVHAFLLGERTPEAFRALEPDGDALVGSLPCGVPVTGNILSALSEPCFSVLEHEASREARRQRQTRTLPVNGITPVHPSGNEGASPDARAEARRHLRAVWPDAAPGPWRGTLFGPVLSCVRILALRVAGHGELPGLGLPEEGPVPDFGATDWDRLATEVAARTGLPLLHADPGAAVALAAGRARALDTPFAPLRACADGNAGVDLVVLGELARLGEAAKRIVVGARDPRGPVPFADALAEWLESTALACRPGRRRASPGERDTFGLDPGERAGDAALLRLVWRVAPDADVACAWTLREWDVASRLVASLSGAAEFGRADREGRFRAFGPVRLVHALRGGDEGSADAFDQAVRRLDRAAWSVAEVDEALVAAARRVHRGLGPLGETLARLRREAARPGRRETAAPWDRNEVYRPAWSLVGPPVYTLDRVERRLGLRDAPFQEGTR